MNKLFTGIGFHGPTIIIVISLIYLWTEPPFFILYAFGILMNMGINKVLKLLIQDPRPDGYLKNLEHKTLYMSPEERFGMPSGHAQLAVFSVVFVGLFNSNRYSDTYIKQFVLVLIGVLTSTTLLQRYLDLKHTPEQILVGCIVGGLFGWILVKYVDPKKWVAIIKGKNVSK
jgi:membrane-associated phospholipid phosphatase